MCNESLVVIKEGGEKFQMLYDAVIKASLFDIPRKIATCLKPWSIREHKCLIFRKLGGKDACY